MIPGDYTLELFRGRARTWRAQLFQDRAATLPVNLTGCTLEAGIKLPDDTKIDIAVGIVSEGDITPADGWIELAITDEEAEQLAGTFYPWGATIIDPLGDSSPVLQGKVIVSTDSSL